MTAAAHMREAMRQLTLCRPLLTDEKVIVMVLDAMTILGCAVYLLPPSRRTDGKSEDEGRERGRGEA